MRLCLRVTTLMLLVATGANAYSLDITVTTSTGGAVDVGDTITLHATIDGMDTLLGPLGGGVSVLLGWDETAFEVANNDLINPPFGAGTQTLFPGFSGAGDTMCDGTGNSCNFINQIAPVFGSTVATGTITGSIVMEVLDISGGDFIVEFGVASDLYIVEAIFGLALPPVDPGDVTITGGAISVVPEPTTAAMLGLGLVGLGFAGRRRRGSVQLEPGRQGAPAPRLS